MGGVWTVCETVSVECVLAQPYIKQRHPTLPSSLQCNKTLGKDVPDLELGDEFDTGRMAPTCGFTCRLLRTVKLLREIIKNLTKCGDTSPINTLPCTVWSAMR